MKGERFIAKKKRSKRINANEKGKRGERELAKMLQALFGAACRRGQQYSGIEGEDVVGLEGIHIECKRVEKLNVLNAVEQAVRDAAGDVIPIVCHRKDKKPWLMTVELALVPELVEVLSKFTRQDETLAYDKAEK